eukprot:GEMP01091661.1.p1 GENE.GEMP01091661.1~~GEMP01091661.1.p1  ORF type:complete len:252 (-),score=17.24 GEMP01091661.1:94-849(-)
MRLRMLISLLISGAGIGLYIRYGHLFTLHSLKDSHLQVTNYINQHPYSGPLIYIGLMSAIIGTSLPGATMMSLSGGVFFTQPFAAMYAYTGYMIGASISYSLVRCVFGDSVRRIMSSKSEMFHQFEQGLHESENFVQTVSFLIFVRYIAFFPFWFVNASCALLSVGYGYFFLTTAIATLPGSLIYTWSGELLVDALQTVDNGEEGLLVYHLLKKTLFEGWKGPMLLSLLAFCTSVPVVFYFLKKVRKTKAS